MEEEIYKGHKFKGGILVSNAKDLEENKDKMSSKEVPTPNIKILVDKPSKEMKQDCIKCISRSYQRRWA